MNPLFACELLQLSLSLLLKWVCCHCRATFDTDNIDVGPERRAYLDHRLSRVWEVNSQVGARTLHAASAGLAAR